MRKKGELWTENDRQGEEKEGTMRTPAGTTRTENQETERMETTTTLEKDKLRSSHKPNQCNISSSIAT